MGKFDWHIGVFELVEPASDFGAHAVQPRALELVGGADVEELGGEVDHEELVEPIRKQTEVCIATRMIVQSEDRRQGRCVVSPTQMMSFRCAS